VGQHVVADLVGPHGHVIGVALNPELLETARARAAVEKRDNVTFVAGHCRDVSLPGERDGMNRGHQEAVRWIEAKDELSAMRRLLREIAGGVDSSR
jgi:hypothetical protein